MLKGDGPKKLDLIPIFFTEIIQSSFNLMKLLAQRKGLGLNFVDESKFKAPIMGNKLELTRIVNNLLSNAITATDNGSILPLHQLYPQIH